MGLFNIYFVVILVFTLCSCKTKINNSLQEGDLVFQDLNCGDLCDAIESVTEGRNGKDFSHCAMVLRYNDQLMMAEAIGSDVHVTPVDSFWNRTYADHSKTLVLRLPDSLQKLIPKAVEFVQQQLGKPYDDVFELNNGSYYCSELIYDAFLYANNTPVFELSPMTFKTPNTDSIMPVWIDYYQALQEEIPQGRPGLNPGSISRAPFLEEVRFHK